MRNILIIDDDEQMRNLLCRAMEYAGFEVEAAADGRKGLRLFEENSYDLVITDLIMPEQEGMETITFLRKNHPDVKIIAISGGGRIGPETYLPAALELGANAAFAKPFPIDELINTVKELLNVT
ncbi:Response regulator receiver domain-containing protein [Candidatus Electrothrix aarhusensis]|jgi:DNA-binding response OmpR family regulator|uniref:Response regulator receiver domain-containing protein n=1 Tax=Candidatus Electrothrix aarhusensis TaxID=1859131 RepID=A0A3S3RNU4_9BACT|nr:Response regulator receiver domain-containing protein [Candidatus Electrothrix aarhusensis]